MGRLNLDIAGLEAHSAWWVLAKSQGIQTLSPTDTLEHTVPLLTIPAGMITQESQFEVVAGFDCNSGNASDYTVGCQIGGQKLGQEFALLSAGRSIRSRFDFGAMRALNQLWSTDDVSNEEMDDTDSASTHKSIGLDCTVDQDLELYYQAGTANDTLRVVYWRVMLSQ